MRIIGFQKKWGKLHLELPVKKRPEFTTFRFDHRLQPYHTDQQAQIFYKPRSKNREKLGIAEIVSIEPRWRTRMPGSDRPLITEEEAISDGFSNMADMHDWLLRTYGHDDRYTFNEHMNKITLRWIE